ncbi:hypothetical protein [Mesorhizobium sp. B2-1-3A]|uniref:hypothetical protein n=1 Tax=Mesorhizobium sp. B2-1-3A TaxID=2589971 RepID=UPI0011263456|nr:hypothetical protein [Mesorhizobium sp. B2-1-3A]TPM91294.1 hypothetical protein FJ977_30815 [Mesorhizobium sp. B2-1-3A]
MTDKLNRFWPLIASAAFAMLLAANAAQSAATLKEARPALPSNPPAEQVFADAPDGVDPVVTGPVTAAFKQRQAAANCDSAVWPNIPMVCYPD